ncbi:hypothetical protein HNQ96_004646 [Aminobacter lissarensis]|uniref:Uncharacterized protein n=1 Tax=Aminobacter carboxidus TaxID=376165 RepID=A0A8E2BEW0_9HYPH|nr:hypothetical protein [Aminobacter lissarensis]MBB6468759.1 hypothetical protein [Aminobacter lissarensis]
MGHFTHTLHSPESLAAMYVEARKNKSTTISTRKGIRALRMVLPAYRFADEELIAFVVEAAIDAGLAVEFDTYQTT